MAVMVVKMWSHPSLIKSNGYRKTETSSNTQYPEKWS
jgi:hypothetical protein